MSKQSSSTHTNNNNVVSSTTSSNNDTNPNDMSDEEMAVRDAIIPALIMRSYHLPGYGYSADLYQYLTNNHPVFGICFHHKYHPVGMWERIAALVGSVLFGLAVTNIIYLAFVFTDVDYNTTYVAVPATNVTEGMAIASTLEQNAPAALSLTNGNIALWTIGSTIHAFYDNMIWNLAACTCRMKSNISSQEKQKRYQSTGTFLVMLSVVAVVAITTFVVALRKALDDNMSDTDIPNEATALETINHVTVYQTSSSGGNNSTVTLMAQVDSTQDFEFMIAYLIELALNFFIYYPIVGTLLFSGILVCGKYETCGGRPYEIRMMEQEQQEQNTNVQRKQ